MQAMLENDFSVPVTWAEDQLALDLGKRGRYRANAAAGETDDDCARQPRLAYAARVVVRSSRSVCKALPWPAPRTTLHLSRIEDYLPSLGALHDTFDALHEMIGWVYYRLRY